MRKRKRDEDEQQQAAFASVSRAATVQTNVSYAPFYNRDNLCFLHTLMNMILQLDSFVAHVLLSQSKDTAFLTFKRCLQKTCMMSLELSDFQRSVGLVHTLTPRDAELVSRGLCQPGMGDDPGTVFEKLLATSEVCKDPVVTESREKFFTLRVSVCWSQVEVDSVAFAERSCVNAVQNNRSMFVTRKDLEQLVWQALACSLPREGLQNALDTFFGFPTWSEKIADTVCKNDVCDWVDCLSDALFAVNISNRNIVGWRHLDANEKMKETLAVDGRVLSLYETFEATFLQMELSPGHDVFSDAHAFFKHNPNLEMQLLAFVKDKQDRRARFALADRRHVWIVPDTLEQMDLEFERLPDYVLVNHAPGTAALGQFTVQKHNYKFVTGALFARGNHYKCLVASATDMKIIDDLAPITRRAVHSAVDLKEASFLVFEHVRSYTDSLDSAWKPLMLEAVVKQLDKTISVLICYKTVHITEHWLKTRCPDVVVLWERRADTETQPWLKWSGYVEIKKCENPRIFCHVDVWPCLRFEKAISTELMLVHSKSCENLIAIAPRLHGDVKAKFLLTEQGARLPSHSGGSIVFDSADADYELNMWGELAYLILEDVH